MSGGTTTSKPPSILSPLRLFATFCVLAPTVAVIAVPTYNSATPKLGGFPFFYWYQLIWVVITGALMVAAYFAIKVDEQRRKAHRGASAGGGSTGFGTGLGTGVDNTAGGPTARTGDGAAADGEAGE
jgi:hypothetical protein